ncbi:unnamed protein product [Symbiodinium sp. CCMP2456]|nr:unnamed protein product [Symbiodinium sp. CCMP2456]
MLPGYWAWARPFRSLPKSWLKALCLRNISDHMTRAKEPEPEVLEPLSKAREVESAEAESTREAESPRDTDSPAAKTVDQEASYIEGSTSMGDGEAHIGNGNVEETRIICETDPNEVIAWRELFFKLGEVDEKPSSSSASCLRCWVERVISASAKQEGTLWFLPSCEAKTQQAPSEHGTWGQKGSLARLLRREGLEMPTFLRARAKHTSLTDLVGPVAAVVLADPKHASLESRGNPAIDGEGFPGHHEQIARPGAVVLGTAALLVATKLVDVACFIPPAAPGLRQSETGQNLRL